MFQKAERKQSKLRLALTGPSGSGKTYSSLQIAKGLLQTTAIGKIAMIDSENGSSELYSNLVPFDVAKLSPPYHPDRYIQMINAAAQAGYEVLIIDSLSHGYNGNGGLLDLHSKATQARRDRNSFAAWSEITPIQTRLIDTLLSTPLHIICTLRTKTAWEVVENDRGKKAPVKVGLSPQQRDGLEYEFSLVLDLSTDGHVATSSKDRTGMFDQKHFVPGVDTGKQLLKWLNAGIDTAETSSELLADLQSQIANAETFPVLKALWQQNELLINQQLTPEHLNRLKTSWLERKQAFAGNINNRPVSDPIHATH